MLTRQHEAREGNAASNGNREKERSRRSRRKLLRTAMFVVLGTIGVILLVWAWIPEPTPVEVVEVRRGTLRVSVREQGRTRVKDRYTLVAPLSGDLARIELDPGDPVRRGGVIARLAPLAPPLLDTRTRTQAEAQLAAANATERQARATIERARLALQLAQSALARARTLASQGGITPEAVERAEIDVRARGEELTSARFGALVADHQAQLSRAALDRVRGRGDLQQLEVQSPIDGQLLRVMQRGGGAVQVGAPLVELGDPAALEVIAEVLTADAVRIEPGAHVAIDNWGGRDVLHGHVRVIEPAAFTRMSALGVEEQRVNVVIDLDDPHSRWASLGDGYRVEVEITLTEIPSTIIAPGSALFRQGQRWTVFVARDGRAVARSVVIGERGELDSEVKRGLIPGEKVIVHPSDRVEDGVRVLTER